MDYLTAMIADVDITSASREPLIRQRCIVDLGLFYGPFTVLCFDQIGLNSIRTEQNRT